MRRNPVTQQRPNIAHRKACELGSQEGVAGAPRAPLAVPRMRCPVPERVPGILKAQRATEAFRYKVFQDHWDGINRSRVGRREGIASATVERHCKHFLVRQASELSGAPCPQVLGIDEHFFSRKLGYATTFCDLKNHSVYDVVLGRSELSLESYFLALKGKDQVRVVCMA